MLVDSLASLISRSGVTRLLPRKGPMVVMYHGLGGRDGVPPSDFGAQLDLLARRREVVPLRDLVGRFDDPGAIDQAAITFDDGYVDFAEIAVPALRERHMHATLFVPAGRIGESNVWDEGFAAERRILDVEGLRELDPEVAEIGGHGFSHRRMAGLSDEELRLETHECRRVLEEAIGRSVELFAYPYGQRDDFDASAEAAVEAAGFRLACSTRFGRASAADARYRVNRVGIEPADDLRTVAAKFDGAYDWLAAKESLGSSLRRLGLRS